MNDFYAIPIDNMTASDVDVLKKELIRLYPNHNVITNSKVILIIPKQ